MSHDFYRVFLITGDLLLMLIAVTMFRDVLDLDLNDARKKVKLEEQMGPAVKHLLLLQARTDRWHSLSSFLAGVLCVCLFWLYTQLEAGR